MVAKEKDPIVADPNLVRDAPEWKSGPPALPWKAVLAGLGCGLAVAFFVAVGRELGTADTDCVDAFGGGLVAGLLTGLVVLIGIVSVRVSGRLFAALLQCLGTSNDFCDFLGDRGLAGTVVHQGERSDHVLGVA